jgi:hypothetical protein
VLVAVIAAHLLVFVLLSRMRLNLIEGTHSNRQDSMPLRWVYLADLPPLPEVPKSNSDVLHNRHPRSQHGAEATGGPPAVPNFALPAENRSIDWRLEAERVARAAVEQMDQREKRRCEYSSAPEHPGVSLPKCSDDTPEFHWDPEPKAAGFIGILPYVRLGKRCIVGLGFFGCAIGALPEADGHLFDHMDDSDRDRISVPDAGK